MSKVDAVKIRMYNTGSVGDCILLLFQKGGNTSFSMLIDCGGWNTDVPTISNCAKDILNTCKGKLDLLVVTHQHEDHISGFNQAREFFDQIKVETVWMSWVEDKTDPIGRLIKEKYGKKLRELQRITKEGLKKIDHTTISRKIKGAAARVNATKETLLATMELLAFEQRSALGVKDALAKRTNNDAMEYVRQKGTRMEYRHPGEVIKDLPGAEGIKFYMLGPPRDKDLKFFKIETNSDEMYGLRMMVRSSTADQPDLDVEETVLQSGMLLEDGASPFSEAFKMKDAGRRKFFAIYNSEKFRWRQIETDWLASGNEMALALTRLTNNTSLAMALEFENSEEVILLPADAQSGNWMGWHKADVMKALREKGGKDTDQLLNKTVFMKVGHHGSHNGTASHSGLDKIIGTKLTAFMPLIQDKVPKEWGGSKNFPAKQLYKVLIERTKGRLVRTDEGPVKDAHAVQLRNDLSKTEKKAWESSFKKGSCYFEFTVKASG
jgi:beta-lactamase superfamily II metal-dependent hydrolase